MPKKTSLFQPLPMANAYNKRAGGLADSDFSKKLTGIDCWKTHLLSADQLLLGVPFTLGNPAAGGEGANDILVIKDEPAAFILEAPVSCNFLVFLHAVDFHEPETDADGFVRNMRGQSMLGEKTAEYIVCYSDGSRVPVDIKRRVQINEFQIIWGEAGLECYPHTKSYTVGENSEQRSKGKPQNEPWGRSQTRVSGRYGNSELTHWLYAFENPYPDKDVVKIEFIPCCGAVFVFGVTAARTEQNPLLWAPEQRVRVKAAAFGQPLDEDCFDMDLGAVVSVYPAKRYNDAEWESDFANHPPETTGDLIVEYTAHPDAKLFYKNEAISALPDRITEMGRPSVKVNIKTLDKYGKPAPVKLHIHGEHGEYLPPIHRHRYPNRFWFEDYSVDYTQDNHFASYIDGDAYAMLPAGKVYIEVTRGPEIKPVKKEYTITSNTSEIIITLDHVLNWRAKGWVSADTHVHFLSPKTAELEGAAEDVNVVNLLASQWGELFTNIGDFDGKTTFGSKENGGDGEYLVRVGTENRQPVLGHISLLGYEGPMILPLTTGGPDEARIGDAVDFSLSLWAEQCKKQNGLVVLPHFPMPRSENAAPLVLNLIDAVEMTSAYSFGSINPYSLSDWYRYLNCGFHVPAVGGTDKMSASMALGAMRTYALIKDRPFTYESWKEAVLSGLTFVTTGPLVDFLVDGREAGASIAIGKNGGTLDVNWQVSSLTTPVTRIELIFNGEVMESKIINQNTEKQIDHYGAHSLNVTRSGWLALRVFGKYAGRKEAVAAHTSAVMVKVGDLPIYNHMDATSILDQIEGATAFIKTIAPRGEEKNYADILSMLTSAHRKLHNIMHTNNVYHEHTSDYGHHDS